SSPGAPSRKAYVSRRYRPNSAPLSLEHVPIAENTMQPLRFDGRTAIVTGAGGNPSLGRAFALLLAERGANVVVNDVGAGPADAGNLGQASAEATCREIIERGGRAVADTHSVATVEGATAIVQTALEAFGGVDIL